VRQRAAEKSGRTSSSKKWTREKRERKTYLLRGNDKRARAINVKNVALVLWIKKEEEKKEEKEAHGGNR